MDQLTSLRASTKAFHPLLVIALAVTMAAVVIIPLAFLSTPWQFAKLLTEHDHPIAVLSALILLVAAYPFRQYAWVERMLLWLAANPLPIAVVTGGLLAVASRYVYLSWPVTMDEYSPWFQAHVFASGSLSARFSLDTLNHLFQQTYHSNFFVINWTSGEVVSNYWPGFAMLLAPFAALGVPWICNPLLVAFSVIALHRLAVRLGMSPLQQGWTMLLAIASPAFTLNGMSFYSMPAHLLFNTLFALCLVNPDPRRLFLAGLAGGYALSLHNPLPHLVFALPWFVWLAVSGTERVKRIGYLLAGYLPFSLLLVLGWVLVTKDVVSVPPAEVIAGHVGAVVPAVEPGAFWEKIRGYLGVFSWPTDIVLIYRLGGFFKLWLWAVPLLVVLAVVGATRLKATPYRLLAASALVTFLAYFLVPVSQGHGWGYRYFHSAWITLPILAAGLMQDRDISATLGSRLAICALASLFIITPIRAVQMGGFVAGHVAQVPAVSSAKLASECEIIFHSRSGFFGVDMVENTPELDACRLTFISRGIAADLEFAQRLAPGGREVGRDGYGWVYRYTKNR